MPNTEDKLFDLLCESEYMDWDKKVEYLIANGVTVQEWISVKDRLPEHGDIVLCHTKHDDLLVFQWCEMSHRWVDQYEDYRQDYITHWMPLPQPPKGVLIYDTSHLR